MDFFSPAVKETSREVADNVKENNLSDIKEMPLPNMVRENFIAGPEKKDDLSLYEKTIVKVEQLDWSLDTIDYIDTMEEYKVYKDADLEQQEVGSKIGMTRSDIDFEQKDEFGRTNAQRIDTGLSPINKNGETIELHHVGQKQNSPFAELTREEHRGVGNDTILHDKNIKSEIDRGAFQKEKMEYWQARKEMEA